MGCAKCDEEELDLSCRGALARSGILKFHWESWSDCNLACSFCYRQNASVLSTQDAVRMLDAVRYDGVNQVVFAGGDPSMRRDLLNLVQHCKSNRMSVEIQTNAQFFTDTVAKSILLADLGGLSLDGPNARIHDAFRDKRGNFDAVMRAAQFMERNGKQFVVRTVVSQKNSKSISQIAEILNTFKSLRKWTLAQFTPVGEGYENAEYYAISDAVFDTVAEAAREKFTRTDKLDIYKNEAKVAIYFMAASDGSVLQMDAGPKKAHPRVASLLTDHVKHVAEVVHLNSEHHVKRYGSLLDNFEDNSPGRL